MKRSIETVIREALHLVWKDIKNVKVPVLVIAVYLWFNRTFFRSSCIWVLTTGFPCPGCGMTRAGAALLHGDFKRAFQIHPFIYAIAVLAFFFCFYRYILKKSQKVFVKWTIVLVIAMLVFYTYRMIFIFPGEPPMSYYKHNLIHTFLSVM